MFFIRRLHALLTIAFLAFSGSATCAPEVGWYWNPQESGRGFFIESKGGLIYLAGYFYEADGRATWLVSGGPNANPYSYQGRLLRYAGGQTLLGAYQPPSAPVDAGAVSLQFSDDRHATLTWPGGTVALERHVFDPGQAVLQPQSGWWWNPAESGRGHSIEVQGNNLFMVGFMYNAAGAPVWYFAAGPLATETRFEGPWLQFANGQTMAGPYQPPSAPTSVGRVTVDFSGPDRAQATFLDAAPAARAQPLAAPVTVNLEREFTYPQPYDPPPAFAGTYSLKLKTEEFEGGRLTKDTIFINVDLTFLRDDEVMLPDSASYGVAPAAPGAKPIHVNVDFFDSSPEFGTCRGTFDGDFPLPASNNALSLVKTTGFYKGQVVLGGIVVTFELTCVSASGTTTKMPHLQLVPANLGLEGYIESDRMKNWYFTPIINEASFLKAEYSFNARR